MTEFRSPQQEPGIDRRLLLVFAATFIILLIFQPFLTKYFGKKEAPVAPSPIPQAAAPAPPPSAPAVRLPAGAKQATSEQDIVVENDLYRITFSNQGAQVKSWMLKKYRDEKGHPLELVPKGALVEAQQNGQNRACSRRWKSTATRCRCGPMTMDSAQQTELRALRGQCHRPSGGAGHDLSFEYSDGNTVVRKIFHFHPIRISSRSRPRHEQGPDSCRPIPLGPRASAISPRRPHLPGPH